MKNELDSFKKQMLDRLRDNDMFKLACNLLKSEEEKKALESAAIQFAEQMFSGVSSVIEDTIKDNNKLQAVEKRLHNESSSVVNDKDGTK